MRYIAIIPARGGSKRLPGKNIMTLGNKPLIAHSIEYAKENHLLSEVYVSTDCEQIAEIASSFDAKVILRPAELATDTTTTAAVLKHAAEKIIQSKVEFDFIVLLQPTNPLRPDNLIRNAISIIEQEKNDSLITVSRIEKKLGKINNNEFIPWNYKFGQRSQDLEPLYYENGLLYITKKDLILEERIMGETMYPFVIDHIYGTIDIDNLEDFKLAEYYYNK